MKTLRLWTVTLLLLSFLFLPIGIASDLPFENVPFDVTNIPEPVPPPKEVRDFFDLSDFWQQWINIEGFPILASAKVSPYATKELAWQIGQMFRDRTDFLKELARIGETFTLIGHNEILSDIPEMRDLSVLFYRNVRARGGYNPRRGSSVEQVFSSASVPVHELAHDIHLLVLNQIDLTFDNRLKALYNAVVAKGLWYGAASDYLEYWAEGVTVWFHVPQLSPLKTREALKAYDPDLALLIAEVFGDNDWRHTPIEMRTHLPHLQGFDPQSAPRGVEWPPGVVEAYEELRNPSINERSEWVNLPPYAPSLLPKLNELRNRDREENSLVDWTNMLVVNTIDAQILFYWVHPDGTETLHYRFHPKAWAIAEFLCHVGDLLLAKDNTGKPLAVFQAVEKAGRVLLAPTLHLVTPGLSKISGYNQKNLSGTVLAYPFVVEVRDENLSALEGISVTFTVTAGAGTLSVTHTTTDENGRAESTFTLGKNLGTTTVSVSAAGIEQPVTFNAVAEAAVDIPDPNLRAAITTILGKTPGAPITPSDMATLTHLEASEAGVRDLTGLEHATNLKVLGLWRNSVSDLSPLAGLTNLTGLYLGINSASDLSPLVELTNLESLFLDANGISDLSALAGLTQLTRLALNNNSISDLSPLAGLTNLRWMRLASNNISDLSPLIANTGLGEGDEVYVQGNPLSYQSIHTHIPTLQSRGVEVQFDNQAHPALLKISGDNQKGAIFASLSQPFVIEAQDENGSALVDFSVRFAVTEGGGTLSTTITRTDENGRAQSTLILGLNLGTNTVEVSAAGIESTVTFYAIADTELPPMTADVNSDGNVNVLDLILIASKLGNAGANLVADVNEDGVVSILDLILAAGMFEGTAAAPSAQPQVPETLTAVEVEGWLTDARALQVRDPIMKRGFLMLEQLLVSLTPKETELLSNYPNPFNPETWIPYRLAEDANVTLTIYDSSGQVVRTLDVGHQIASAYESRSKAVYWDGRNEFGEPVASGIYFYTLTTGDYSATRRMVILK